jgi:hypothetical protein
MTPELKDLYTKLVSAKERHEKASDAFDRFVTDEESWPGNYNEYRDLMDALCEARDEVDQLCEEINRLET